MEKMARFISLKTSGSNRVKNIKYQISNIKNKVIKKTSFLIFLVLALAGFLRLYRIEDYMTFLGDEGRDVLVAYNILHGNLTLLGPTASVGGFFLGPIYYYFMAPFLWLFNYNPVGPAIMVGLFGVATVWLLYKVGSEFFGFKAGLIAAILYAISPLVIAYSRSSWNPNLMPFFSLLTLYILYKAVAENKIKLFIVCGFLLGITMQLHYLAIFLGVIVAAYTVIARNFPVFYSSSDPAKLGSREVSNLTMKQLSNEAIDNSSRQARTINFKKVIQVPRDYFYVLLGFIIGWSAFLLFEIRHGFPNLQSIIHFVFQSGDTGASSHFFETIYNVIFRLFGRLVTNFPPPEQVAIGAHPNIALWYFATLVLSIVSVALLVYKFVKNVKDKEEFQKISLLLIWLLFGIGFFGFYKKPIYDYYLGFMFPLPFLLVGLTISSLYANIHELIVSRHSGERSDSRIPNGNKRFWTSQNDGKWGLVGKVFALGIFVVLFWINLQGIPFRFSPNRQLAQVEQISKFVINKTDNKPFNFALIAGGNSDHGYRYFFTLWDKSPVTIENPKKDPQRKTVTEQLLIVCEDLGCKPLGNSLWEVAGFGRAEIVNQWDVSVVKVYKLRHYEGW